MRREGVTQGMRMEVPVDVGDANVFLHDAADGALRKSSARIVEEHRLCMQVQPAAGPIRLLQEVFAHRPIFLQGFLGLGPIGNDAFLTALAADAQNAFFSLDVHEIEAREFADAQAGSVKKLQEGPVAPKEQAFSGSHGTALSGWRWIRAGLLRKRTVPAGSRAAVERGSPCSAQLIEEAVHFFSGEHRRDALGQLGCGNKTRGVFLEMSFAHAVFEERAQSREFSRDGTLLQALIVEVRDEFTNQGMRDPGQSRWPDPGRRQI